MEDVEIKINDKENIKLSVKETDGNYKITLGDLKFDKLEDYIFFINKITDIAEELLGVDNEL